MRNIACWTTQDFVFWSLWNISYVTVATRVDFYNLPFSISHTLQELKHLLIVLTMLCDVAEDDIRPRQHKVFFYSNWTLQPHFRLNLFLYFTFIQFSGRMGGKEVPWLQRSEQWSISFQNHLEVGVIKVINVRISYKKLWYAIKVVMSIKKWWCDVMMCK